ncbi:unnamed protein product, partial [Lynx pardinus]
MSPPSRRSLEESVGKPLYLIFRNLCQMQEDNSSFSLLLDLLSELYQKQPKIGYHLLYYLRARWVGASPGTRTPHRSCPHQGLLCDNS